MIDNGGTLSSYRLLSLKTLVALMDRLNTSQLMGFTEILYSHKWIRTGISICANCTTPQEPMTVAEWEAVTLSMDFRALIRSWSEVWRESCRVFDLHVSRKHFERLDALLEDESSTYRRFTDWAKELAERLADELDLQLFVRIDTDKSQYLELANLFGDDVHDKFPSCSFDIEEAGGCLAFHKNTACVFHLMRVMEVGLRAIGKSLNDASLNPKTNPSWDSILKRCDSELQKKYADRSPEWRQDSNFFNNATANLRAVKDAWRNPTMHIEAAYDDERALDVYNAVRAFMRHLAKRLND